MDAGKGFMRYRSVVLAGVLATAMQVHAADAVAQALPLRNGRPVVAVVGQDPVYLDALAGVLESSANLARLRQGLGTADELAALDRLVNIKLLVQEADRMGIGEAPEIEKQMEVTSREIMRDVLFERLVKDVRPDATAVDRQFKDAVREWKTTSLLFKSKTDAEQARKDLASGASFATVARKALAAKAAKSEGDDNYHGKGAYLPQIAEALARLRVGQVSPVIQLPTGFVVMKVVDVHYPSNPEALAKARTAVLNNQREKSLEAHEQALRRQYVVVNKAVLASIDYVGAKPGIDALLKDKRVVAQIKGGASITVGELTDYLRMQFFHGTGQAKQRQEMNARKQMALDATVGRRLYNMEALRLGIEKTNEYRDRVRAYKEGLVFDAFIKKVIVPPNKMTEAEVRKYYDGHIKEFSSPEMMKVRGLAFAHRAAAEDAMRKLRAGADYGWLAANAVGRATPGTAGLLTFDGRPVTTSSMPDGVRKALAGARPGDARMYASPEGTAYMLEVQGVIAPSPQPYDGVREDIAKKLYNAKLKKAVDAYAAKLRAKTKVETYLKRTR